LKRLARKKEAEEHAAAAGAGESKAFRITCSEPERESEKVEQLYQAFLQAKQTAGEETRKLSRSSFNEFVLKKNERTAKAEELPRRRIRRGSRRRPGQTESPGEVLKSRWFTADGRHSRKIHP